jgi:hypothetical protein
VARRSAGAILSALYVAGAVVDDLIGLTESQIAALLDRGANLDGQALGLIGFDAALITAVLAGTEALFGPSWAVPLPGLALSVLSAGLVMRVGKFDLGPDPAAFYADNLHLSAEDAGKQLLADLLESRGRNFRPLERKTEWLIVGVFFLAVTFAYSALIMGLE